MKFIKIIHENADPIEVQDNDKTDLASYTKNLAKRLEVGNVSILETSSGSAIVRPSRVCSILVSEINDEHKDTEQVLGESNQIVEDIITDGE